MRSMKPVSLVGLLCVVDLTYMGESSTWAHGLVRIERDDYYDVWLRGYSFGAQCSGMLYALDQLKIAYFDECFGAAT